MKAIACLLVVGCFLTEPILAQPRQQEALELACAGATPAFTLPLQQELDLVALPSISLGTDPSSAAIARGIVQRSWSLVLANSSTLDGYRFPVALQIAPPPGSSKCVDRDNPLYRFRQSTLAFQYVPLILQRQKDHPTGITSSSDRKGSITYTLPLFGIGTVEDAAEAVDREIRKRIPEVLSSFTSQPTEPFTDQEVKSLTGLAEAARLKVLSRPSVAAVLGYTWDTRNDKPNAVNVTINGTKTLKATLAAPDKPIWLFNASLGETMFSTAGSVGSYSKLTTSIGFDITAESVHG